jgi:hypothetical protein
MVLRLRSRSIPCFKQCKSNCNTGERKQDDSIWKKERKEIKAGSRLFRYFYAFGLCNVCMYYHDCRECCVVEALTATLPDHAALHSHYASHGRCVWRSSISSLSRSWPDLLR